MKVKELKTSVLFSILILLSSQSVCLADDSNDILHPALKVYNEKQLKHGPPGVTGITGATGATGPAGSAGSSLTGATGAIGAAGATGSMGPTGSSMGFGGKGATGAQGATGANGLTGARGPGGSVGPTGDSSNLSTNWAVFTATNSNPVSPTGPDGPPGFLFDTAFESSVITYDPLTGDITLNTVSGSTGIFQIFYGVATDDNLNNTFALYDVDGATIIAGTQLNNESELTGELITGTIILPVSDGNAIRLINAGTDVLTPATSVASGITFYLKLLQLN